MRRVHRTGFAALIGITVACASFGVTAANIVPDTRVSRNTLTPALSEGVPAECSSISVTNLVTGSGSFSGTSGNDLVLASSGIDSPNAGGGNDCIVAGDGADVINCGTGTDVAIGGPGIDTFNNNCETKIQ